MSAKMRRAPVGQQRGDVKYVVRALHADGSTKVFNTYGARADADKVAARLRSVGCPARVVVE